MKIVIFTNIFPYPLNEGGKTAQFYFLQNLVKENKVVLGLLCDQVPDHKIMDDFKFMLPGIEVKVLQNKALESPRSFKTKVIDKLIWLLRKRMKANPVSTDLTTNPFFTQPVKLRSSSHVAQIVSLVAAEQPDIVQVDFIENADIALLLPQKIKKVLVIHDLRFASVAQSAALHGHSVNFVQYSTGFVKAIELAFINTFDGVVCFSEQDREVLANSGVTNICTSPFAVSDQKFKALTDPKGTIKKIVFLGPDHHTPNLDGMMWYAENFALPLYEKFGLVTHVIGSWSEQNKRSVPNPSAFTFLGFVEDLEAIMNDAAMVVPLRIGSGIRTKILEAFAMGVPVISTSIGVEGIGAKNGTDFFLADDLAGFEKAFFTLVNDQEQVIAIRQHAQALAKVNFSQDKVYRTRIKFYEKFLSDADSKGGAHSL